MTDKFRSAVRLALASSMRGLSIEQQADALEFLCANAGYCPSFNLGLECPAEKGNTCRGISRETWLAYFEKQSAESLEDAMLLEKKQAAARRRGAQRISGGPSMTAEQWLADLEAKANVAIKGEPLVRGAWDLDIFHEAANPAAVLRLVAMVRWLSVHFPGVVRPCAGYYKCFRGDTTKCEGDADAECWITAAYVATEDRHDQD